MKENFSDNKYEKPNLPEGVRFLKEITIGTIAKDKFVEEMKKNKIWVDDSAKFMIDNPDFLTSKKLEHLDLVKISVKDLGFPKGATIKEIYKKAQELGLELCPSEVGPQLRLQYPDQAIGTSLFVGMEPDVRDSRHYIFKVYRSANSGLGFDGELGLSTGIVNRHTYTEEEIDYYWNADDEFVFVSSQK